MSQPVKLIALLKATPGMSREEFAKRWVEGHCPLTLKFKNLKGYRVNVAIDEYQEIEGELPSPESRFSADYDRTHAWDNRFVPDITGVPVLTDDRNPVDLWSERINRAARRDLHEYFRELGSSW